MSKHLHFKNVKSVFRFLQRNDGSLSAKTIRSTSWVGATSVITNLLSLIRGIILARLLTPEIFGLMSICLVVIRGVEIFTETGFGTALIHRQKNYEEEKDTAFTLMVIRGFCLAIFTVVIAPFVAEYYEKPILDIILKIIAISFILNGAYNINTIGLQKDLDFKRLSYLAQLVNIINFVIVVTLAFILRNIWALVIGHVASCSVGTIMSFTMIPGKPRLRLDFKIARQLFSYGKFITGLTIVIFITTEIDNILIGKILGMTALGYYVLAYSLANIPATHISKVISGVLFPAYSKLQDNLPALQNAFLSVLKLVSVICIPVAAGLAVLAPEIIRVVYGDKWLPAAGALIILSIFGCIRSLGALNGYLYNAIGKPNITFYSNLLKLLVILILIYPLTERYGLVGASIAVTGPIVVQYILEIYVLGKVIKLTYFKIIEGLIVPPIYSVIMCSVVFFLKNKFSSINAYELAILIGVGVLTYFLLSHREIVFHIKKFKSIMQD